MGQIPHERIVFDPDIMMGKPTIEGPRITVELIFEELGEELAVEDLSRAHAHLAKEQVSEALRFAADYMPTRTSRSAVPKQHEGPGRRTRFLADECPRRDRGGAAAGRTRGGDRRASRCAAPVTRRCWSERCARAILLTAEGFGDIAVGRKGLRRAS